MDMIPVTLLTGFLGSGKTTVLNRMVPQPEMADALVLINEFGEIGLDHLLVAHSREDIVVEMSSGCLCCTIRSDLVHTLKDTLTVTFLDRFAVGGTAVIDPACRIATVARIDAVATVAQGKQKRVKRIFRMPAQCRGVGDQQQANAPILYLRD